MFEPFRRNPAPGVFRSRFLTYAPLRVGNPDHMQLIKTQNLFNRVDMYAGFCMPLGNFLKSSPRGFRVEMTIEFGSDGLGSPPTSVRPSIDIDKTSYPCSTLKDLRSFSLESFTYEAFQGTWARQIEAVQDLTLVPASDIDSDLRAESNMDFPDELFQAASGMCAWRGVQVNSAQAISGHIQVTYAFSANKAFQFEVELKFSNSIRADTSYVSVAILKFWAGRIPPTLLSPRPPF